MKWMTIIIGVMAIACLMLTLRPIHHTMHHPRERWADNLLILVMFFQQLATYTRSRYWNAELT